jgi:hypothetical protein
MNDSHFRLHHIAHTVLDTANAISGLAATGEGSAPAMTRIQNMEMAKCWAWNLFFLFTKKG